ncbi:suppressor of lurcher protein 1-like [Centruroides vittatus]|uniref:suppressor of lurcher protein 1-like n=1 Tax=Centruroides vittatus TaxID=120091 RepID=UPI0035105070
MAPVGRVCNGNIQATGQMWVVFLVWTSTVNCGDWKSHGVATSCDQTISSETSKNGTFTSPNYPEAYPSNVFCVYQFEGKKEERVQILFTDFDLYMHQESTKECEGVDSLVVFITVNGQKEQIDNFCGNELPAQLMSNGPTMTVQFRSYHSSKNVKGFRAIYRFVTNFGMTAGRQDSKIDCRLNFNSTERTNGTFTSPNWPGYYPRDTECHYLFYGNGSERVYITFAYFDVDGIPPCESDSASDYVEFSNFRTVDRKIPKHCGSRKPKVIESDGDFFRVTFKSNDKFDGTGFEAFYQFRNYNDPFTIKRVATTSGVTRSFYLIHQMAAIFISTIFALAIFKI